MRAQASSSPAVLCCRMALSRTVCLAGTCPIDGATSLLSYFCRSCAGLRGLGYMYILATSSRPVAVRAGAPVPCGGACGGPRAPRSTGFAWRHGLGLAGAAAQSNETTQTASKLKQSATAAAARTHDAGERPQANAPSPPCHPHRHPHLRIRVIRAGSTRHLCRTSLEISSIIPLARPRFGV